MLSWLGLSPSHPTRSTISDLAYFREVEAIVTASRDSTVKVWEADWQIRMVFVGHTGAPLHRAVQNLHPLWPRFSALAVT